MIILLALIITSLVAMSMKIIKLYEELSIYKNNYYLTLLVIKDYDKKAYEYFVNDKGENK